MNDIQRYAADPVAFFAELQIPSAHGVKRFELVWADYQREWFETIAPSLLAVAAGEKPPIGRFWVERTKGGSKDSDCACCLLYLLAFSRVKLDMEVGAADRDQALELKKAAEDVLRLNPWLGSRIEVQSWTLRCKATGSECDIIASDVAGSHGSRPDIVVMNELSHVTKEEFSQNLLDNATKKPQGLVIVATNSGFSGSWQEKWREIARTSDRWHFHTLSQPAPWLSDAEIDEAQRRNSKARFQRLFWGAWPSQSGDALDDDDIRAAINPGLQPGLLKPDEWYVGGLDLGVKHDHSALVVVAGNLSTLQLRLALAQSWTPDPTTGKVDLMAVEDAVLAAHRRFDFIQVGYDPHQAALLSQRLEQLQVPMVEMTFTGANLNLMASTLMEVFRSRRLEMYDHPALVKDLGRLTIEEKSYGHRLSAVSNESGHADLATALAIALPIAVEVGSNPPIVLTTMFGEGVESDYGVSAFEIFRQHQLEHEREQAELNGPNLDPAGFFAACVSGRIKPNDLFHSP